MRSPLLIVLAGLFVAAPAAARTVNVANATELLAAIGVAAAGDEIVLASGTYRLTTSPGCNAVGRVDAPIVVRSATRLGAQIELDTLEGFRVSAPHWRFDGLDIKGVCADDNDCEHAFHVTGGGTGFVLTRSRVVDFNAQLKVNAAPSGAVWLQPNAGLVEETEVYDTHARATAKPVTKLNIDAVDGWTVRANFIHDGQKNGGDGISYQSFMKGGGKNGLYERNLVICSRDTTGGTRIGLSLGGGGTGAQFCAPAFNANVPCTPEMTTSTIRNNVIVNCSDVGIYLNKATDSKVLYNTIIATSGIDFRFAASTGEADGNVLAGIIRPREGGTVTAKTNLTSLTDSDFTSFYIGPLTGDLRKKGDLSRLLGKGTPRADVPDDFCARPRSGVLDLGAHQASLGDCGSITPPGSDGGAPNTGTLPGVDGGPSTGGPSSGSSGESSDAGARGGGAPASSSSSSSDGCGCRVTTNTRSPLVLLFGAVLLAWRSRSSRRSRQGDRRE